jgi:hypothetical protein
MGYGWTDTGLVFGREDGTMIHPHTLIGMFEHRAKAADLPAIRLPRPLPACDAGGAGRGG